MVKLRRQNRLVPACATEAVDGMEIESQTEEVYQVRKTALELLLSDHVGDCLAPCHFACPAHMDVPGMLRQIAAKDLPGAIVTVKELIALPAVLGRVCPKPCEKGCRRASADGAVAVCEMKRFVADADLATGSPYLPRCEPATGKRIAIVGAGPTGLCAAYFLRRKGHAVTILDAASEPGGRLRHETTIDQLPRSVLDAEIATILGLGVETRWNTVVGECLSLDEIRRQFDVVLLACGNVAKERVVAWGLKPAAHGILVDKETYETNLSGVFAAGNAIRRQGHGRP